MADKDDNNELTPEMKKAQTGSADKNGNAVDLKLDLSTDPEFLALAADFEASISGGKTGGPKPAEAAGAVEPPLEEVVLEEPTLGEPTPEEPAYAEAAGLDSVMAAEPAPAESATAESALEEPALEEPGPQEVAPEAVLPSTEAEPEPHLGPDAPKTDAPETDDSEEGVESEKGEVSEEGAVFEEAAASEEGDTAKKKGGFLRGRSRKRRSGDKAEAAPKIPYLGVVNTAEPTMLSRLFNTLSLGALLVLTAIFFVQVVPGLQTGRLLWFSDELRQADVLAGVFNGNWLQIQLNGQLYQEAPPLYFWFLMGLHKLMALGGFNLGDDYATLLYIGAALSGLFLLWATYGLARSTAHLDRRGSFAAGCVLLSVLFLQFFFHYSSLDLFFAAFIITSHIFMFKALMRERAPLYMGLAFLCASVALMSKGALGLVLPLLSAVLFSLWRGKPQRLLKSDFLLCLILSLLPAVVWLGSIWATGQHDVVMRMLREQLWVKAFGDAWHKGPWWYYLAVLPALWMPWSCIVLTLPWQRLFSASTWENIKSARTGERQGLAFVWIFFLGAFLLISLIQHKQPVYVLPLMGPLAVLTGRAALQLSPWRGVVLQRLMAILFFVLSIIFVLLPVYYSGNIPAFFSWLEKISLPAWEVKINGIFLLAVIMLGTTCLLIGLVRARRTESTLLVLLLSSTLFSYPLSTMTMPSLDSVVSSKAASVELRRYADLGYYPVSFKVYPGVFSYYSGMVLNETDKWAELDRMVAAQPKTVVAMNAARWEDWTQNPGFTEVMRFWMLSNEYVLLLRNATPEEMPPHFPPLFEFAPEPEAGSSPPSDIPIVEDWPAEELPDKKAPPAEAAPVKKTPVKSMPVGAVPAGVVPAETAPVEGPPAPAQPVVEPAENDEDEFVVSVPVEPLPAEEEATGDPPAQEPVAGTAPGEEPGAGVPGEPEAESGAEPAAEPMVAPGAEPAESSAGEPEAPPGTGPEPVESSVEEPLEGLPPAEEPEAGAVPMSEEPAEHAVPAADPTDEAAGEASGEAQAEPGAESPDKLANELAEEIMAEEILPEAEELLPESLPLHEAPMPDDPFAPFPAE